MAHIASDLEPFAEAQGLFRHSKICNKYQLLQKSPKNKFKYIKWVLDSVDERPI